ncbi:N-acetylglucosamine kinase [Virgibacillus sp. W0430]|uniref:N-acetylglucosamine kinase n=1 Tax=Virgibacillus sp. W0430 TaxID=3391580 RepID=UPI003F4649F6
MYMIGIDGGGTKTEALLYHTEKGVLSTITAGPTNPHSTSFKTSVRTVTKMIKQITSSPQLSNTENISISIGLAGLGRMHEREKWKRLFIGSNCIHNVDQLLITSDALPSLYSGTYGNDGIVTISGTGSVAFGLKDKNEKRIGGWGHLVSSDPGSGYFIGYKALEAVFNQYDGIGEKTAITDYLLESEGKTEVPQLIQTIYDTSATKERVASYATHVFKAIEAGDSVAQQIIEKSASLIARNGIALYNQLVSQHEKESFPFVLVGGIFKNERLLKSLKLMMMRECQFKFVVPTITPVYGNIVYLLKDAGFKANTIEQQLTATQHSIQEAQSNKRDI